MKNSNSNAAVILEDPQPKTVEVCARRCSTEVLAFKPREKSETLTLPSWIKSDPNYRNLRSFIDQIVLQLDDQTVRLIAAINKQDRDDVSSISSGLCDLSESVNASGIMRQAIRIKLVAYSATFPKMEILLKEMIQHIESFKDSLE